jgi:hypothetical protein
MIIGKIRLKIYKNVTRGIEMELVKAYKKRLQNYPFVEWTEPKYKREDDEYFTQKQMRASESIGRLPIWNTYAAQRNVC